MATPVIMPRQGQSVESCILTEWYKEEGDQVSQGDLLFAYETDKAAFEEEAQADGLLLARFFEEGDEVPVLVNAAVIGTEGESVDEFRPDGSSSGETAATETKAEVSSSGESATVPVEKQAVGSDTEAAPAASPEIEPGSGTNAVSPRARKLAREKRVVLEGVAGSGPGGVPGIISLSGF